METTTDNKPKAPGEKMLTGLSPRNREHVARELNSLLSDEVALYIKTLNFHWNIESDNFHGLHVFLEEQYNTLQGMIDSVAERVRKVGYYANGSMKEFIKETSLKEVVGGKITKDRLAELAADHDTVIRKIREMIERFDKDYEDAGSADFITGLLQDHEKMSWMLHATVR